MPQAYLIEFDLLDGHTPSTGATLEASELAATGWRSIGARTGGRFTNNTGVVIRAIYLKTNLAGDTFTITAASAGRLFDTVWLKNDHTEAYFLDGHIASGPGIPASAAFWMRVPPNSDDEIATCDGGGACPFTGQLFESNPPDPTGNGWTKVKSVRRGDARWQRLVSACPSLYRDITVYGESPDGHHIVFISRGELHAYNDQKGELTTHATQKTVFSKVNRIAYDQGSFSLLSNGIVVHTLSLPKEKFSFLGAIAKQTP